MTTPARATTALISLNIAIYFVMFGAWVAGNFDLAWADRMLNCLALPSSVSLLVTRPWTILTYMFTHVNFLHLAVNMLWLISFGAMFRGGWKATTLVYLAGGILGATFFLVFTAAAGNHGGTPLTGASSAVIAVVVAATVLNPGRRVRLFLLGDVKLKWVAPVALLTLFGAFTAATAAHIGGVVAGVVCGLVLKRNATTFTVRTFGPDGESNERRKLLDKAASSGYASLSRQEQLTLFNLSAGTTPSPRPNSDAPKILNPNGVKKFSQR